MFRFAILLMFALSSAGQANAVAPPGGFPPADGLYRARWVGIDFNRSPDDEGQYVPRLQFLSIENYNRGTGIPEKNQLIQMKLSTSIDLSTLSPQNYIESIEALAPDGVRFGMDCLVYHESRPNYVEVEPYSPAAHAKFLARHMRRVIDWRSFQLDTTRTSNLKHLKKTADHIAYIARQLEELEPGSHHEATLRAQIENRKATILRGIDVPRNRINDGIACLEYLRSYADENAIEQIDTIIRESRSALDELATYQQHPDLPPESPPASN